MIGSTPYIMVRRLGSGAYGEVVLARNIYTREEVAIKITTRISDPVTLRYLEHEILNQRVLRHSHVIAFKEVFEAGPGQIGIAMEYAQGEAPGCGTRLLGLCVFRGGGLRDACQACCVARLATHCLVLALRQWHITHTRTLMITSAGGCPMRCPMGLFRTAGGSLFSFVQRKGKLAEADARWFFQQLCMALDFVHQRQVGQG
jgi:serine/threonine protein kinase